MSPSGTSTSEPSSSGPSTPVAEPSAVGERGKSEDVGDEEDKDTNDLPPRKRQRVRLSCLECRRRKLSCDRGFPCERCIKSGTPERCTYETRPGLAPPAKNGLSQTALASFDSRLAAFSVGGGGSLLDRAPYAADIAHYRRDSHRSGGTPTSTGPPHHFGPGGVGGGSDGDRIRRLEMELAQLKAVLLAGGSNGGPGGGPGPGAPGRPPNGGGGDAQTTNLSDGSTTLHDDDAADKPDGHVEKSSPLSFVQSIYGQRGAATTYVGDELRFFRGKEFKTRYFGPHNACMAFSELTGLCPFMKETAEEWLRPLHVHHHKDKDKAKRKQDREEKFQQPDADLEALLPSREETDMLVSIYLDQFEQVHRIVHIPSFRREYASFWDPGTPRPAAFTALLLSMMSLSSCLRSNNLTGKFVGMISQSHHMAEKWNIACENWTLRQSQKHRKLVHYQIACLVYLGKRVNCMKKKRFWKASGALVQDAVSVGLHREPSHIHDSVSVYNQEMRRRIWATIQEFDMQASFDHGLPTLLGNLRFDVHPPRNLADEDFDEDSTDLPPSRPMEEYTFSSYQSLSRRSLSLRLQLTRVLTGPPEDLDYDQVIQYTNDLTQEIDALPSWDVSAVAAKNAAGGGGGSAAAAAGTATDAAADDTPGERTPAKLTPLLAYTLLHVQLRQYIIPLHQPYLKLRKTNSKYQYSEIIYYNAARDMVLLHDKLAEQGVRTLNFLREDALTLSINLCSVTMLQPRGIPISPSPLCCSTNMIMVNSQHTKKLLEKCLALKEDRVLRCGHNEPWGYSIMCAASGLLEAHLGDKTPEAAKASSAERFVNLHYRLLARQDPPVQPPPPSQLQQQQQQMGVQDKQGQAQAEAGAVTRGTGNDNNNGSNGSSNPQVLNRPKPGPPFIPLTQGAGPVVVGAATPTPAAWWMSNMANMNGMANMANPNGDPSIPPAPPMANPEFSMELMNMNLGDLWADYSWEEF